MINEDKARKFYQPINPISSKNEKMAQALFNLIIDEQLDVSDAYKLVEHGVPKEVVDLMFEKYKDELKMIEALE